MIEVSMEESLQKEYFKLTNGHQISVIHNNLHTAPALLFVHGFGGRANQWQAQLNYFNHQYHVIAYDQMLEHITEKTLVQESPSFYTLDALTKDCEQILKKFSDPRTVVVAHSYGAALACKLAIQYPTLISRLILLAPIPLKSPPLLTQLLRFLPTFFIDLFHPLLLNHHMKKIFSRHSSEKLIEEEYNHFAQNPTKILHFLIKGMPAIKYLDVSKISQPVLVIYGTEDILTWPSAIKESYKAIRNTTFREIKDTGHMLQLEQPDLINYYIEQFLLSTGSMKQ